MSRRKPLPYMRMYWRDLMADVGHLSRLQQHAYLMLIERYWDKQSALTEDEARRFSRMEPAEWEADRELLAAFFTITNAGWRHRRVEAELQRTRRESKGGKKAGEASGKARRAKAGAARNERSFNDRSTIAEPQHITDEPTAVCPRPPVGPVEVQQLTPAEDRLDEGRALVARLEALARADTSVPATITRLRPLRRSGT